MNFSCQVCQPSLENAQHATDPKSIAPIVAARPQLTYSQIKNTNDIKLITWQAIDKKNIEKD